MRRNFKFNQRVTRLASAGAWSAFMLEPQRLPRFNPRWDADIERFVVRKLHPLFYPVHGFEEADFEIVTVVHAAHRKCAVGTTPPKQVAEDIGKIACARVPS